MDRIHNPEQNPFTQIEFAAVAIGQPHQNQRHTGMLYRDPESNQILFLHLAWHRDLHNEAPAKSFLWVTPAIHPRRARQVAAICRKIWKSNGRHIPYAFSPPNDCFDETTWEYLFGPTRLGLTCATFVLAVFHEARLALVDYSSWPANRPGDAEWQQQIVSLLRGRASEDHVRAVEQEVGGHRYRPEEVAGAATVKPLPAEFEVAVERGQQILAVLENVRQN